MKVTFQSGQLPRFEFEASSPKEIFERLAVVTMFSERTCGCCAGENIIYEKRDIDNGSYLSLRCLDCRAQLDFGQNKDGKGIFKKTWDKDSKRPLPNKGWYIYGGTGSSTASNSSAPSSAPIQDQGQENIPF